MKLYCGDCMKKMAHDCEVRAFDGRMLVASAISNVSALTSMVYFKCLTRLCIVKPSQQ